MRSRGDSQHIDPPRRPAKPSKVETERRDAATRQRLADVVAIAFPKTHDGWSTDEAVLKDDLNQKFLAECQEKLPEISAAEFNWTLLNLRKAGKRGVVATKRARQDHDRYRHAAEIAARFLQDKHKLTIDRLLCDPDRRAYESELIRSRKPRLNIAP